MRKILFLMTIVLLAAVSSYSQAPGIFNYQGVARNSVGNVLANKSITLRLTIHDGTAAGPTVFQESRAVVTNPFGLFNVQVGSPGGTNVTGNIPGVSWGVGAKYIQVEIDPNGGTAFINIGTAQLASVPYALFANSAADLILPFNKTQADAGTLFKITNSGTGSGSTALEGLTNSTAGNVSAVIGTVTSVAPGAFSAGVRGINNGTGGNGIGVYGSQNGSGYGVYGTAPSGWAVRGESTSGVGSFGSSTSGTGVVGTSTSGTGVSGTSASGSGVFGSSTTGNAGMFTNTNAANTATTVDVSNNGTNNAINSINTGTGRAGFFQVNNAASTADALTATTNGIGASWAFRATSTGTNGAGLFISNNATATNNNLQSNTNGLGRAGLFNATNVLSTANAVEVISANIIDGLGTANAIYARRGAVPSSNFVPSAATTGFFVKEDGNGVAGYSQTGIGTFGFTFTGVGLQGTAVDVNAYALKTFGRVQITGQGAALNKVLTSDAVGNATWQSLGAIGGVTGSGTVNFVPKWTPVGTNLGNSQIFDNGTNVGINTITPTYKLDVDATGASGIRVSNTSSFATVDILGAGIDQALRFGKNGTVYSGINTLPDGDHINFFKFGAGQNLMSLNVNTGNFGVGGPGINAVSKVSVRGFNVANNLYSSSTGFLGATGVGVNDITAQPTNEKWGVHTFVDGAVLNQHAIFAESGTTAVINTGLFGRVSTAPTSGQSFALFAFDPINNGTTTWAATIRGRLQYRDGTQGLGKILTSDAAGNASWQTAAGAGVSGSGTLNFVPKWTPNGVTLGNSQVFDNGTNVGIANVNPTQLLHMGSGGNPILKIEGAVNNAVQGAHIRMTETFPTDYGFDIYANGSSDELSFNGIQANVISDPNILVVKRFPTTGVGIGTSPTAKLDVAGNFKLVDGTQGAGKILTSDASGFASWQSNQISLKSTGLPTTPMASGWTSIGGWTTIQHEEGGANFNPVTGQYTITRTGLYEVKVSFVTSVVANGNYILAVAAVNGVRLNDHQMFNFFTGAPPFPQVNYTTTVMLTVGDIVSSQFFTSTPISIITDGNQGTNKFIVTFLH